MGLNRAKDVSVIPKEACSDARHAHARAHPPHPQPPPPSLPPPSHRRDGSVKSKWLRVSAVESDLNTGVGTDTQTERDAVRKSSPRRTETVPGVQEAQKKTPTGFYFFSFSFLSLFVSLFRALFWLFFYACDQRGYLNWTCELRELTREPGFFLPAPQDEVLPSLRPRHFGGDRILCGAIRWVLLGMRVSAPPSFGQGLTWKAPMKWELRHPKSNRADPFLSPQRH